MKLEIKNRFSGSVIFSIETENWKLAVEAAIKSYANLSYANLSSANLRSADLSYANLSYANLSYANLSYANLRSADLSYANLSYANLSYANLSSANLRYANLSYANLRSADLSYANLSYANLSSADLSHADLSYAKGINKNLITPLRILLDQPGPIWAYKLVNAQGEGPFNGGINYLDDKIEQFSVKHFDDNENEQCGAGINLATLDWVIKEWKPGYRILIMEFFVNEPKGNLCVPTATDGKFRVKQCRRIGEKDLKELGLGDVGAKG